ncbi:MAG: NfeD family protein [Alistipes sp.]|nr:NfeD family protein [Alistipes sp.]
MWIIVLLVVLGLVFLFAELLLLPGLSVGAFLSLICYGGALYVAFDRYSAATGAWCIAAIVVLSLIVIVISLRAKTWRRLSLEQKITSSSGNDVSAVSVGERGRSVSRLAPVGRAEFGGRIYEAKSQTGYIDAGAEVEVVGFDDFSLIVKPIK